VARQVGIGPSRLKGVVDRGALPTALQNHPQEPLAPAITSRLLTAGSAGGNGLLGVLTLVVGRVITGVAIVGIAGHRSRSSDECETEEQGKNGERMCFHVCLFLAVIALVSDRFAFEKHEISP
jgi:hypothetical protein